MDNVECPCCGETVVDADHCDDFHDPDAVYVGECSACGRKFEFRVEFVKSFYYERRLCFNLKPHNFTEVTRNRFFRDYGGGRYLECTACGRIERKDSNHE